MIHLNYSVDDPRAQSDAQVEADAREAGVGLEMPALAAPVGALAAAVGMSRVVNGVHYPSDIVGGWAVGVGVGMLTLCWWPLRRSRPAAP